MLQTGSKVRQRPSKASRCRSLSATSSATSNDVSFPILLAFAGVFDGHDGPKAAEYCATGLLPHIFLELQKLAAPKKRLSAYTTKMSSSTLPDASTAVLLEQTYVNAFHHAHERFGSSLEPPSIEDNNNNNNIAIMGKQSSWRSSLALRRKPVHRSAQIFGGTTACTLSLVRDTMCVCFYAWKCVPLPLLTFLFLFFFTAPNPEWRLVGRGGQLW